MRTPGDFDTQSAGTFGKTHGLKGEIVLSIDTPAYEATAGRFIFAVHDGELQVPYLIESVRTIKDAVTVVKLKDVDYDAAGTFNGLQATAPREDFNDEDEDDDNFYLEDLVGFSAYDGDKFLGEVTAIDDSTSNVLVNIRSEAGRDILVPATEELIHAIDIDSKCVTFALPEGLTELN